MSVCLCVCLPVRNECLHFYCLVCFSFSMWWQSLSAGPSFSPMYFIMTSLRSSIRAVPSISCGERNMLSAGGQNNKHLSEQVTENADNLIKASNDGISRLVCLSKTAKTTMKLPSEVFVVWSNGFRSPLLPHLSHNTSNNFSNFFPKQKIQHSHPPHTVTGQLYRGEKLRGIWTSNSSSRICSTTISVISQVYNWVQHTFQERLSKYVYSHLHM